MSDSKKVAVRQTENRDKGLFAVEDIRASEFIAAFDGEIYEAERCSLLPNNPPLLVRDHAIQFAPTKWRDSDGLARYANHSCEPNAGIKNLIEIVAMRDIKAGEEILWDYEMTEDSDWNMKCLCGSPRCRKVIRAFRFLPKATRRRYGGFISEWLTRQF
jgi:SET domain-containing protein